MCKYCNSDSNNCCVHYDESAKRSYISIETSQWDEYNDEFFWFREYVNYCPYCGRKLQGNGGEYEQQTT